LIEVFQQLSTNRCTF